MSDKHGSGQSSMPNITGTAINLNPREEDKRKQNIENFWKRFDILQLLF